MSDSLEFTGERFTPECEREIWYEHMHRYAFAAPLCKGKTVLDAACGEGYGSALIAGQAVSVTGVDLSAESIEHARSRYGRIEGLSFEQEDCTQLPYPDHSYDRIVSFETLEHLIEQEAMLEEFRRLLKPDGLVILSSPDKAEYSDKHGFDNEFHVRELYRPELESLLHDVFPHVELLGQKLEFHSSIWSLGGAGSVKRQTIKEGQLAEAREGAGNPMYFIAVCALEQAAMPDLQDKLWLFDDEEQSVYQHYVGEIRRNMAAGGLLAERDTEIRELKERLGAAEKQGNSWFRRWFGGS